MGVKRHADPHFLLRDWFLQKSALVRDVNLGDPSEANEIIILANHLLRIVDRALPQTQLYDGTYPFRSVPALTQTAGALPNSTWILARQYRLLSLFLLGALVNIPIARIPCAEEILVHPLAAFGLFELCLLANAAVEASLVLFVWPSKLFSEFSLNFLQQNGHLVGLGMFRGQWKELLQGAPEARAFYPQLLSNMNRGAGYRLRFGDFTFHERDCLTPNGSGFGFPNPDGSRDRWTWKAVSFAREDVLRVFADWPVYAAWKLARGRGWEPPRGMSADWLKTLAVGRYVSLTDAVDLLAFGPGRLAIGLNSLEEHVARLRAGLALMRAAKDAKVIFFGKATFRLPQSPGQIAPPSALRKLEPTELAGMTLVIDGARDWLGPAQFADQYPETGQAMESVRFAGVTVQRDSLGRWLAGLSGKTSKKRGPRPAYPWQKIEARLVQLMDYHGDFSADDPEWNAQARLEEKLMEFCEAECHRSPSPSQLRAQIKPRLAAWRNTRK